MENQLLPHSTKNLNQLPIPQTPFASGYCINKFSNYFP